MRFSLLKWYVYRPPRSGFSSPEPRGGLETAFQNISTAGETVRLSPPVALVLSGRQLSAISPPGTRKTHTENADEVLVMTPFSSVLQCLWAPGVRSDALPLREARGGHPSPTVSQPPRCLRRLPCCHSLPLPARASYRPLIATCRLLQVF